MAFLLRFFNIAYIIENRKNSDGVRDENNDKNKKIRRSYGYAKSEASKTVETAYVFSLVIEVCIWI